MESPQYIEPTFAMRVKLASAGLASALASKAFSLWVQPILVWVATLPTCESLPWVRAELIAGIAVCWFISAIALRQAVATWRSGQAPTPGTWVWVRTRIYTGVVAQVIALGLCIIAAVFSVGPIVVFATQELYVIFCIPVPCSC